MAAKGLTGLTLFSFVCAGFQIWNDILFYKPCMAVCGAFTHLHQCSLNIQVQGKPPVRSIAKRLISERLAWAKCPKEPAASHDPVVSGISELLHPQDYIPLQVDKLLDDDGEAEGCHEDVFVLDIIGGHYFWAYVGSEAMHTVDAITDQLLKEAPALKRFLPNVGNLVVVEERGADGPSIMRGKVIEMSDDQVMVFAIDHGCMKQVTPSQIYQLSGSATCLTNFGAQAKVCCLAGGLFCECEVNTKNVLYSSQREIKAVFRSYTLKHNEELHISQQFRVMKRTYTHMYTLLDIHSLPFNWHMLKH